MKRMYHGYFCIITLTEVTEEKASFEAKQWIRLFGELHKHTLYSRIDTNLGG